MPDLKMLMKDSHIFYYSIFMLQLYKQFRKLKSQEKKTKCSSSFTV